MTSATPHLTGASSTSSLANEAISTHDVVVEGHRLRLYENGDRNRPHVLWLHGSGPGVNALANWRDIMTAFSGEYHNVAPDVLGFGNSECPDPFPRGIMPTVQYRAENLLALLDELEMDSVHIVGNSMGGMIALRMALLAPSRVDRIVLMGSAADGGLSPLAVEKQMRFVRERSLSALTDLLRSFVYDEETFGVALEDVAAERLALALDPEIARVAAATFDPEPGPLSFPPAELGRIVQPTLVVHGREDRILPIERAVYLAQHISDAHLHVVPRSGHWAHLEQPETFRFLMRAFLDGNL